MLLAGVVLLRHQGVVEGRLADGAEAVRVPRPRRSPRPPGLGGGGSGGGGGGWALLGLGGYRGGLGRCRQRGGKSR